MRLSLTALALFFFSSPVQAVTCSEVRDLAATELAYWAERLQVTPTYLATLLEKAFCESGSKREPLIAPGQKRGSMEPLTQRNILPD
jgi:hypothetical protein